MEALHKILFEDEPDIVRIRQTVRHLLRLLDFEHRDEIRVAAAASELARAARGPLGKPVITQFFIDAAAGEPHLVLQVTGEGLAPEMRGRGTPGAESVVAAEKLVPPYTAVAAPDDATLLLGAPLPRRAAPLTAARVAAIRAQLNVPAPSGDGLREEIGRQNRDLAQTLLELGQRQQELDTLNVEIRDTNRGVMALYAELDERANHLRRADELKTRFLSNMSHEFRTPLNSVLALSQFLLDGADGPLTPEQRRQVTLIKTSVSELLDLVSDLLDLAKVEAGKSTVSVAEFSVVTLFGALRAMIRPLLGSKAVALELGAVAELPPLVSDEGKIAQILRNFLSNAVKFTEHGTISVSAQLRAPEEPSPGQGPTLGEEAVLFAVTDTGIGIAPEHRHSIFEAFGQVEHRLQRQLRGTGLGLRLCRELAGLLGGKVWVESELGRGSTFYLLVPRVHAQAAAETASVVPAPPARGGHLGRVLVLDDDPTFREILVKQLQPLCGDVVATGDWQAALGAAASGRVDCAVLDLMMPGVDGFTVLQQLRAEPATGDLPVLVCSSKVLTADERGMIQRLRAAFVGKDRLDVDGLAQGLQEAWRSVSSDAGAVRRTGSAS